MLKTRAYFKIILFFPGGVKSAVNRKIKYVSELCPKLYTVRRHLTLRYSIKLYCASTMDHNESHPHPKMHTQRSIINKENDYSLSDLFVIFPILWIFESNTNKKNKASAVQELSMRESPTAAAIHSSQQRTIV